jgi:hypothetical protein
LSSGDPLTWANASILVKMSPVFSHYNVAFLSGLPSGGHAELPGGGQRDYQVSL